MACGVKVEKIYFFHLIFYFLKNNFCFFEKKKVVSIIYEKTWEPLTFSYILCKKKKNFSIQFLNMKLKVILDQLFIY